MTFEKYKENNMDDDIDASIKQWPEHFDLDEVPGIAEHELKPKPDIQRSESVNDYLKGLDIRAQMSSQMASPFIGKQTAAVPEDLDLRSQPSQSIRSDSGLSQDTINLINQKHTIGEALKQRNMEIVESQQSKAEIDSHMKLAEQIKQMFTSKDKTTMSLLDILENLKDNSRGVFI